MTTPKLQVPIVPDKQLHEIALLRRQLAENQFQFQLLTFERRVLESKINEALISYHGAAAVAEAAAMWGCE